jgi:carbon storage regulator
MLVLTRRIGEEIVIGEDIRVMLVSIKGQRARIGIEAPRDIRVKRCETEERSACTWQEHAMPVAQASSKD